MNKSAIFTCCCLASTLLLGGCVTLSGSDTTAEQAEPVPIAEAAPGLDWDAERQRLTAVFEAPDEITVSILDDGGVLLRLPAAEGFGPGSAEPAASLRSMLDRVAIALEEPDGTALTIVGHTDSAGSETFNLRLSIERAEAVMEYLRQRGLPLTRMHAEGHGEGEPIADNRSETGRATNRRVEILVQPLE